MTPALRRRRAALFALFFIPGLAISSWVTRTPDIRDLIGASTAQMGLVLFGLSVGSMIGILASGPLVARFGARPIVRAGMALVIVSMPLIGAGAFLGLGALVTLGLCVFGLGMGGAEIAMNVEGADVEQLLARPVLPALHGFFSLGTVAGALAGIGFTATRFPVVWHLVIVGVVTLAILLVSIRELGPGVGRLDSPTVRGAGARRGSGLLRDGRLLLIAVIVLAMALAEGTANDWLPLVMVDGHGFDAALGSAIYAVFAASMTIGRFAGGPFIERFGRPAVLCVSALAGAAGLAVVIFADNPLAAGAAVILWGLGASLGFPVAISAAGASGAGAAARVSFVATVGYVAFLVGPPVLGFIGEHSGLRSALIVPLVIVIVAAILAPFISARTDAGDPAASAREGRPTAPTSRRRTRERRR